MKENIITVIGSLNFDIILKQKRLAAKGETYTADSLTTTGGGKGANQAVQCAKLGASTWLVGAVGSDTFGDFLLRGLAEYGVNTEFVNRVNETTGVGVVQALEDGTVAATISQGANYTLTRQRIDEATPLLVKSNIVIFQLETPVDVVEYGIHKAKEQGCYVLLNAAPAAALSPEALSKVDCLVVNEPEASFYCGEVIDDLDSAMLHCEELFSKVGGVLIITLGKGGSLLYDGINKLHIKAADAAAIETTGAGDSYIGAFAFQILNGAEIGAAARFASEVAGITVTRIGAQPAMPTMEEFKRKYWV
ncbi:ribokinase [Paenibacillus terrae]|uniref:Ribokinase n=1 Tax=Paenibacillus terrae TaxID=159743 RepID=A0A0D7WY26_9BACL|nr:ribokinase [Paenibacillus terrae]KJD43864.1 carbohydrate kinase [Paenibacillus terrae]